MREKEQTVSVWDPLVRICHWGMVFGVSLAFLAEDDFMFLHVLAGHLILGLVVFRLVWGVVGPRHARFYTFVRGPRRILSCVRSILKGKPEHYVGHNPAGGGMVVAILLVLLLTVFLGMAAYDTKEFHGILWPMTAGLGMGVVKLLGFLHELFANLLLILVVLHVTGVLVATLQHRENLVKSMFTGRKRAPLTLGIVILGMTLISRSMPL
ncbi:MAG: cytochrome b/b6 domain-containing protein [Magnetococcales bacterium]|nr:cytochrome b/b6 domain-containing protein [Magnetococcales bacterium]MBF0322028.1 cytochrome b/b6 domain-containing protein [Magnetococcales bacterium]